MTKEALEMRRAYKREWAKRNPDKIRAQQERYWQKRAESEKAGTEAAPAEAPAD